MLNAKFGWKLAPWFWRRIFLNFINVFLLFHNYLPLEMGMALHLNKLESPPKDALCQVWLKLADQVWRRIILNFVKAFSLFCNYVQNFLWIWASAHYVLCNYKVYEILLSSFSRVALKNCFSSIFKCWQSPKFTRGIIPRKNKRPMCHITHLRNQFKSNRNYSKIVKIILEIFLNIFKNY